MNDEEWRGGMERKESLKYYRRWKKRMGVGGGVRSGRRERIVRQFQANTLLTRSKLGRTEEERKCGVCGVLEDLGHVVRECRMFERLRERYGISKEKDSIDIIFGDFDGEGGEYLVNLHDAWNLKA